MSFDIPKGWEHLSQDQLFHVLSLYTAYDGEIEGNGRVKVFSFLYLASLDVIHQTDLGWMCKERSTGKVFIFDQSLLPSVVEHLSWMDHPEQMTVRLEYIDGHQGVNMWLHGLMFGRYLALENFYQAFLSTKDEAYLRNMASILYQLPDGEELQLKPAEAMGTLMWYAAVKNKFGEMFPHFFKPASSIQDAGSQTCQRESTMMQIRLLTKGDVTKKNKVINTDTWDALEELDALAKESDEFRQKHGKT